jgi:hypothetical protein
VSRPNTQTKDLPVAPSGLLLGAVSQKPFPTDTISARLPVSRATAVAHMRR